MVAQPELDVGFLFDMLPSMGNDVPPPLVLRRYSRRIEQLATTSRPDLVWVGRVFLAAMAWETERGKAIAKEALATVGVNPDVLVNIAVGLQRMGEVEESLEYTQLVLDVYPAHPTAMANHLIGLHLLGQWSQTLALAREHLRRLADEDQLRTQMGGLAILDFLDHLPTKLQSLEDAGVGERQIQLELMACWATFREHRVRHLYVETASEFDPDDGRLTFYLDLCFSGDVDRELQLEADLSSRLSDMAAWNPAALCVGFKYVEQAHANDTV